MATKQNNRDVPPVVRRDKGDIVPIPKRLAVLEDVLGDMVVLYCDETGRLKVGDDELKLAMARLLVWAEKKYGDTA